jgi:predicted Rossmann-fold nucleotide-binding protein
MPNQELVIRPRLPVVGVMGSGSLSHSERASRLGRWLAGRGVHLLTGGAGTASEAALAVSYRRPIVAFLNSADEIPGLHEQVPVQSDFDEVCRFILQALA